MEKLLVRIFNLFITYFKLLVRIACLLNYRIISIKYFNIMNNIMKNFKVKRCIKEQLPSKRHIHHSLKLIRHGLCAKTTLNFTYRT